MTVLLCSATMIAFSFRKGKSVEDNGSTVTRILSKENREYVYTITSSVLAMTALTRRIRRLLKLKKNLACPIVSRKGK